jgi:NADH dehydrogenase
VKASAHPNHQLPRLSVGVRLALTLGIVAGWGAFLSAWVAGAMVSGWGLSFSILSNLGDLLDSFRQTVPLGFWIVFGLHAASLPLINGIGLFLLRRMALPRGFRAALGNTAMVLAALDLLCWLLLGHSPLARALLPWLLTGETAVLALLVLLPVREMWIFTRWKGAERPQRVVIVGGGFGGLYAAMSLDRRLGWHPDLEVTLVDKTNYFLFPPLLPSVATGAIECRQVTNPFRRIFEATNVRFKKQSVERIDPDRNVVYTEVTVGTDPTTGKKVTEQATLEYDFLVLAPGAATNTFNVPGADEHAFFMRELGDAIAVRNRVIDCFEHAACENDPVAKRELVQFVVVGAGPTGVELAAEIQDLIEHVLLRRYPEIGPDLPEVHLVQSGGRVLPGWHDMVAERTARQLQKIEVHLDLGARVVEVGSDFVRLKNDSVIHGRTVIWCTGVKPAPVIARSGLPLGKGGKVDVESDMRAPGYENIFVLGDVTNFTERGADRPLPALAQVALQQGGQTGPNLIRLLKGQPTRPFKYLNYGALICVGEHFAVVDLMGIRFSGFIAWLVWRLLYLAKLVGFGNRVRVVLDWTMDLLLERSISQLWTSREELQVLPAQGDSPPDPA